MKAAVLHGVKDIRIEERPDPGVPAAHQVKVRIKSVGICGSDVHYFAHGRIGQFVVERPMILGHEAAGIVESVGAEVAAISVGDVVALEPGIPCGTCELCRKGKYNLCDRVSFFATPPVDGALVDSVLHPEGFVYRAPAGMGADIACLAEPASVAVQAVRQAGIKIGERALVIGAGPIGILTALMAEYAGAAPALIDINEERLRFARNMGLEAKRPEEASSSLYDVVFECSGATGTVERACDLCRSGGVVVLVGMHQSDVETIPVSRVIISELQIRGVFRYANTYPAALDFLAKNTERMAPFFTSFIDVEDVPAHFHAVVAGRANELKTIVRI